MKIDDFSKGEGNNSEDRTMSIDELLEKLDNRKVT